MRSLFHPDGNCVRSRPVPHGGRTRLLVVAMIAVIGITASSGCPSPAEELVVRARPLQCLVEPNRSTAPPTTDAVYYGSRAPSVVPIGSSQILAIVGLAFGRQDDATCSGTLITEDFVLTARHCTAAEVAEDIYVLFGVDDENPQLVVETRTIFEHPEHDMALLELALRPSDMLDVEPIPIDVLDLSPGDFGSMHEQSGYGRTETGTREGRFFAAAPLVDFRDDGHYLVVDGQGERGVCYGDSGGPSLRVTPGGSVRVAGTLGFGASSCTGRDNYARVDFGREWIESFTGPAPLDGPVPCGTLSTQGRCNLVSGRATYCADGLVVQDNCGDARQCGFQDGVGFRCVAPATDLCAGRPAEGICDGEVLSWCVQGVPYERNCGACGERCLRVSASLGSTCRPSDCGTLNRTGRCRSDGVAEWCDSEGRRQERNCAAEAQECAFINDDVGFYCVEQVGCGDLTFEGRCDGNVASWCTTDGEPRRRDCTARGEVCAFVNESIGFYCTPTNDE